MPKRIREDKWLFFTVLLLTVFGLVMVFSASAILAEAQAHSPYHYVQKQALYAFLGMISLVFLMRVDYRKYNSKKVVYSSLVVTFLLLVGVFLMHSLNNTHRWFKLGPFLTFQPSELAKPVTVLFLAWYLQSRVNQLDDWKHTLLPAALPPLVFIALILKEPDLGTALVCAGVTALMLYLAGIRKRYLGFAALLASPVLYWFLFRVPWRKARMLAYLHPGADIKGNGYHITQSLIAVGSGGLTGRGLMEGLEKLYFLPEAWTDFIFANIGEELGLLGSLGLVALFVFLGYRGLRAAYLSTDPFARLLAFGLTVTILIQAYFNMSVAVDLVPTKGITLPFVSFGGTSLFFTLASMGVLLNVSRSTE